ncbi:MAG TPA: hypothetical protein VL943_00365 [Niabella sp.]|nr:hypothetical protein [Niabella sp.]
MNRTMISFLTNEQTPKRLQEALKKLKKNGGKIMPAKKDKLLTLWGVSFLSGFLVLFLLLVFTVLFLY